MLQFPLACNKIEDNVRKYDADFVQDFKDDFGTLLSLFKVAKILEIETLY